MDSGPEEQSDGEQSHDEAPVIKAKDNKKVQNSEKSVNDNRTKDTGVKKGKKSRKKRDDSDDDIEKVLAELELEYSGGKREAPQQNKVEEDEDNKKSKSKTTRFVIFYGRKIILSQIHKSIYLK